MNDSKGINISLEIYFAYSIFGFCCRYIFFIDNIQIVFYIDIELFNKCVDFFLFVP